MVGSVKAKQTLREIKLMKSFQHENITKILDLIPPQEEKPFNDLYIVEDLMETDLNRVICSQQELTLDHTQVHSRLTPWWTYLISDELVLYISNSSRAEVSAQRQHHPSRSEAFKYSSK